MSVSDNNKNRGAHGDSSFMLGGVPSSSENPSDFGRGECQKIYIFADDALVTVLNLPPRYRNAANGAGRKT